MLGCAWRENATQHALENPRCCLNLPRQDHPFGFIAKPDAAADGSTNLYRWKCKVPGKEGTLWEGGLFPLTLDFGVGAAGGCRVLCFDLLLGIGVSRALPQVAG